jgi:hypothetical protein
MRTVTQQGPTKPAKIHPLYKNEFAVPTDGSTKYNGPPLFFKGFLVHATSGRKETEAERAQRNTERGAAILSKGGNPAEHPMYVNAAIPEPGKRPRGESPFMRQVTIQHEGDS